MHPPHHPVSSRNGTSELHGADLMEEVSLQLVWVDLGHQWQSMGLGGAESPHVP